MSKRNKIIVSIVGITIVLLALLGITYAYYLTRIEGNTNTNSISITTADLKLKYADGNGEIVRTAIMPGDEITKTFSVENTGDDKVTGYVIVIENVINELTRKEDLTYSIYCKLDNGTSCGESLNNRYPKTSSISIIYSNDIDKNVKHNYELVVNYIYLDTINQSDDMGKRVSGKINIYDAKADALNPFKTGVSATDNTNLAYTIIENARLGKNRTNLTGTPLSGVATSISGKQFDTTVTETANQSMTPSSTYVAYYWTYGDGYTVDEKNGITLTGVKTCKYSACYSNLVGKYLISNYASSNSNTTDVPETTKGLTTIYRIDTVGASATSKVTLTKIESKKIDIEESILTSALDDHGTSYYFRGNVQNNYVNFAGMCWRIVRIAGDGSTKLILEDAYTTCDDTVDNDGTGTTDYAYTGNWNIGGGAYGYDYDEYVTYKLNYLNPENTGMALAFKNYQTTLAKKIDSSIGETPTLEQVNNTLASKLKAGDWCLDDSAYSDTMGTNRITDLTPYYSGHTSFYYGAYTRIYNQKTATLKCNGRVLNDFNDNGESSTPMYVATLTADEIVYAGADSNYSANYNYYLMNEYSSYSYDEETGAEKDGYYWWSLSPYDFGGVDRAFLVSHYGDLGDNFVGGYFSFRPAVTLLSGTTFAQGGNGTKSQPYEIG